MEIPYFEVNPIQTPQNIREPSRLDNLDRTPFADSDIEEQVDLGLASKGWNSG